jgi:hypothetical protein
MRLKIPLYFLTIVLISLNFSCGKKDNPSSGDQPAAAKPIFPLKVGNRWVYDYSNSSKEDTLLIIANTQTNGKQVFTFAGGASSDEGYFNCTDGLFYEGDDLWGIRGGIMKIVIKSTLSINDSTILPDNSTLKVISKNEALSVPAGNFTCFKLFWSRGSGDVEYIWMSAGTGIVQYQSILSQTYPGGVVIPDTTTRTLRVYSLP